MRMVRVLLLLAGALLVSACGLDVSGGAPDTCDAEGALLLDSFSGEQNCGWATYNRGGAVAAVADGVLRVTTSQPGQLWWTNPGRDFGDVVIDVQAQQVSGPNDNAYGVICRYQDEENFYVFLISGDGYYAIGRYESGSERVTYLTEGGQFVESAAINQGAALNQLQVRCAGNELSLAVNGEPLLAVTDATFAGGDVGLAASTFQPGTAVVEFDNLRVQAP